MLGQGRRLSRPAPGGAANSAANSAANGAANVGAGAAALALLATSRGPLEPPIRAEIFGAARFAQHGRSLGKEQGRVLKAKGGGGFFPRLRDNIAVLTEAHRYIGEQERSGRHVSPAGEWLLDNIHVVESQMREVQAGLPRRYFRGLPVLADVHLAGLPRVYGIAWAFVAHADSAFDEALLVAFLSAYQEERGLTLGELWALPTTLARGADRKPAPARRTRGRQRSRARMCQPAV